MGARSRGSGWSASFRATVVCVLAPLCLLVCASQAPAQNSGVPAELTQILKRFSSADGPTREAAFRALVDYANTDARPGESLRYDTIFGRLFTRLPQTREPICDAVVTLLHDENTRIKRAKSLPEDGWDFLLDLSVAAAALRDPRALPDLISNIRTGAIVTDSVAAFGADALPHVLKTAADANESTRSSGMLVLSAMLEPRVADRFGDTERAAIKRALIRGAADESRWVRQGAIQGLTKIPGDDVTSVLKKMAESDPYVVSRPGQPAVFPVRKAAAEAILKRSKLPRVSPTHIGGWKPADSEVSSPLCVQS